MLGHDFDFAHSILMTKVTSLCPANSFALFKRQLGWNFLSSLPCFSGQLDKLCVSYSSPYQQSLHPDRVLVPMSLDLDFLLASSNVLLSSLSRIVFSYQPLEVDGSQD